MSDGTTYKRFSDILFEKRGINRLLCPTCGDVLVKINMPLEGPMQKSLPYMFCSTCNLYYVIWREEDVHG